MTPYKPKRTIWEKRTRIIGEIRRSTKSRRLGFLGCKVFNKSTTVNVKCSKLENSSWNFNISISPFWLFCSQTWPFFSHFNYLISHLQLTIKIVKFDLSFVAEILIFELVNFDYFVVKNDYLSGEKRTRWIVRL